MNHFAIETKLFCLPFIRTDISRCLIFVMFVSGCSSIVHLMYFTVESVRFRTSHTCLLMMSLVSSTLRFISALVPISATVPLTGALPMSQTSTAV